MDSCGQTTQLLQCFFLKIIWKSLSNPCEYFHGGDIFQNNIEWTRLSQLGIQKVYYQYQYQQWFYSESCDSLNEIRNVTKKLSRLCWHSIENVKRWLCARVNIVINTKTCTNIICMTKTKFCHMWYIQYKVHILQSGLVLKESLSGTKGATIIWMDNFVL